MSEVEMSALALAIVAVIMTYKYVTTKRELTRLKMDIKLGKSKIPR